MKHSFLFVCLAPLLLAWTSLTMAADDAPQGTVAGGINEIVLERTFCNGTCPIDTLVLRADGTAEYTGQSNTRLIGAFVGELRGGHFDQLAQWLILEEFFELQDTYGSPNVDSAKQVIRVTRGGERKSVVNSREHSLKLWAMGNVIRAIGTDIQWQPVRSGIRGTIMRQRPGEEWRPLPGHRIVVYPEDQGYTPEASFELRADQEGRFEIALAPGRYSIRSRSVNATPLAVVVARDRFTDATIR